ncbi:hypothetical protein IW140_002987 [Coemansia sp. RSA 1813]|nr:hypothetical protein EV178_003810 [Coemansia sp. RSA 1646]KAJ1770586.1 hypothetical protein LPJ74_003035 [Coemansia sp. RSA 1843]KAJ2091415.1 hypothetical protein IW138_001874 [Coemansia sp. RSA 986]KAJ2212827.1 hypothetical protein EV179_004314 [Coemansia sp. RSA 487]KAJ2569579.1 hypothetical protein IW140_002987 [Coemansia sp. RSA 1813]
MTAVIDPEHAEATVFIHSAADNTAVSSKNSDVAASYKFFDYRTTSVKDGQSQIPPLFRGIVEGLTTRKALPGTTDPEYRTLPTILLYDDLGLELFDRITYLPEYYLTTSEIDILETKIQEIVAEIPNDSDVIELGCGSLRKTTILLDALNKQRTGITYYAIDVMPLPLHESMESLSLQLSNVSFVALCGSYEEVMSHFKKSARRKTILWLGSSIGGCTADYATDLLSGIVDGALNENDAVMIGMDLQKDPAVIMDAYHDSQGVTAAFELNALSHVNNIVSAYAQQQQHRLFDVEKFKYFGEYDANIGRHNAYIEAQEDMRLRWPQGIKPQVKDICGSSDDLVLRRGDRIYIESSHKYGPGAADTLARTTRLAHVFEWTDSRRYYSLNLFRKPKFVMQSASAIDSIGVDKAFDTIPGEKEWRQLWSAWDTLALEIIPHAKLHDKPIDLRHPFIFYLGHMPAFADIHMTAADTEPLTEPAIYAQWFERGIDPNIKSKAVNHSHSEIPTQWPTVDDIVAYRDRVHLRILRWLERYERCDGAVPAEEARHVWMAFEHQAMHIETFFYMILQMSPFDIQPPVDIRFRPLEAKVPGQQWLHYAGGKDIAFGLANDDEQSLKEKTLPTNHIFGWDNEGPQIRTDIEPFSIQTRPITNQEYLAFLSVFSSRKDVSARQLSDLVPCSWIKIDRTSDNDHINDHIDSSALLAADYAVRTVVGAPSIVSSEAALWPVFVSHKQAEAYAQWCGKRLPSEVEWTHASRTFHLAAAISSKRNASIEFQNCQSKQQPVDAYLETLLTEQDTTTEKLVMQQPFDLYIPSDSNIGFAHWHPVPVKSGMSRNNNTNPTLPEATFVGNGWEWTTTMFQPYDGFKASPMYPGYSADFFDPEEFPDAETAHYVVKGGSYATHPRIAQRQTFRNWYQRGYPYVLATFRLCTTLNK